MSSLLAGIIQHFRLMLSQYFVPYERYLRVLRPNDHLASFASHCVMILIISDLQYPDLDCEMYNVAIGHSISTLLLGVVALQNIMQFLSFLSYTALPTLNQ